jgi:anti-anti-sigma factor
MTMTVIELQLRPRPGAARAARDTIASLPLSGTWLADARLLTTELVSNSLRHARLGLEGAILLRAETVPDCLRVELWDTGCGFGADARRRPEAEDGGGRGLALVERLAERWGVWRAASVTCVWFELGCSRRAAGPITGPGAREPEPGPSVRHGIAQLHERAAAYRRTRSERAARDARADPHRTGLELRIRRDGDRLMVALWGDLDGVGAEILRAALDGHGSDQRELVIDLRPLRFLDSAGVRLLLGRKRTAEAEGYGFSIVPGHGAPARTLELLGIDPRVLRAS